MNVVKPGLLSSVLYASNAHKLWEDLKKRFDKVNGARVQYLRKEIHSLTQGTMTVTDYFSKLRDIWDEFDTIMTCPSCPYPESKRYLEHFEYQRLIQLLIGLNEYFSQARSQITMIYHIPSVNKAYFMIIDQESRRNLANFTQVTGSIESTVLFSNRGGNYVGTNFKLGPKRNILVCDYYHMRGHTKENYYKLVGYPPDFKSKRRGGTIGTANCNAKQAGWMTPLTGDAACGVNSAVNNDAKLGQQPHGPYRVPTCDGKRFFVTVVDDYTRFTWTFFMHSKSDTTVVLKEFFAKIKNILSACVKILRTDNERKHRTILEIARALRFKAGIPLRFWGECVNTTVYLLNKLSYRVINFKSPFELLYLHAPSLSHLKVFGCLCYAIVPKCMDKFVSKAIPTVLLGYSPIQKGYKLYDLQNKTLLVSKNVVFKDDSFPFKQLKFAGTPIFLVMDLLPSDESTVEISQTLTTQSNPIDDSTEGDISPSSYFPKA
ncbi:uncharacterized protein [Nicotiana sylvestris]|uniref:uncharacterized protein n=1 Tax=Nicotiana sylvestris TaxID=4096 RepID=UPI00388CE19D